MVEVLNLTEERAVGFAPAGLSAIRPKEWLSASLPKLQGVTQLIEKRRESIPYNPGCSRLRELANRLSEELWEQRTGVKPANSHFTLVFPVHNEEACLESVLDSFMASHLPSSVDAQIVFVTNACSDRSCEIVRAFLGRFGKPEPCSGPDSYRRIFNEASKTSCASIDFVHIDVEEASKPLALNIANELARARGHKIVISVDANNWLEPDSLSLMFADCHRHFCSSNSNVVAMDGSPRMTLRSSRGNYSRIQRWRGRNPALSARAGDDLLGWMMGWDSAWLHSEGGVPSLISDDYAIALLARKGGNSVAHSRAGIWGYMPNSFSHHLKGLTRSAQGHLQLKRYYHDSPAVLSMIASDHVIGHAFKDRLRCMINELRHSPLRTPFYLGRAIAREYALLSARRQYKRNPDSSSWDPIPSTKGF